VPTTPTLSPADAVELVQRYTTLVWVTNTRGAITGNGTGISLGDGKVLTNHHVVQGAAQVWVRFDDGRREPVQVLRTDPRRDLAMLQSSFMDQPAAQIGDSRALRATDSVFAVGYPMADLIGAQSTTVTRGIFSGLNDTLGVRHVQTDTPINSGNSGGPLTDSQGRVIGVVTWKLRGAVGLNYAVASDEVHAFLQATGPATEPVTQVASLPATTRPAATVRPQPTERPAPTPTVVLQVSAHPAVSIVREFYASINARAFRKAWDLLGPSFRARNQYDGWVKGFETTRSVQVISASLKSQSNSDAVVEFTVLAIDDIEGRGVSKTFEGAWALKSIDGAWKLDAPSIRQTQ
jgi:hypothetical protein